MGYCLSKKIVKNMTFELPGSLPPTWSLLASAWLISGCCGGICGMKQWMEYPAVSASVSLTLTVFLINKKK